MNTHVTPPTTCDHSDHKTILQPASTSRLMEEPSFNTHDSGTIPVDFKPTNVNALIMGSAHSGNRWVLSDTNGKPCSLAQWLTSPTTRTPITCTRQSERGMHLPQPVIYDLNNQRDLIQNRYGIPVRYDSITHINTLSRLQPFTPVTFTLTHNQYATLPTSNKRGTTHE